MRNSLNNPIFCADKIVLLLFVILLICGWFSICGASHELGDTDFFSLTTRTGKQILWICCSLGLGAFLLMIDEKYFDTITTVLYFSMMLLLLITPFIAKDIKGSRSWISLGSVSLQPAEFAKCVTALALAKLIGQYNFNLSEFRNLAKAVGLVLLPMVLIILQSETGSALVYLAFFLMFYREGMPGSILFTAVAAVSYFVIGVRFSANILPHTYTTIGQFVVLGIIWINTLGLLAVYIQKSKLFKSFLWIGLAANTLPYLISRYVYSFDIAWIQLVFIIYMSLSLLWHGLGDRKKSYLLIAMFTVGSTAFLFSSDYALNKILEPHQQTRVRVLLGMEENNRGAGYNVNQSKIAIGSGGLFGKGFMHGTQTKLKYVPEQDTDFIFCTVGEEQGFFGSTIVLLLFLTLILRIAYLSERQTTVFGRVFGYCVLSILLFHVFINIGMVLGVTPVIGIPLPFFSYGGSSLWGFTFLIFIFLRIDAENQMRRRLLK